MAEMLVDHEGEVNIFVPHYAMSGGTYLVLAAENIYMDRNANLGPINPQIGRFPAVSVKKVLKEKKPEDIDDRTLILGDISDKAISQVRDRACEILTKNHYSDKEAQEIIDELMSSEYTHSRMINFGLAQDIGLRVSDEVPSSFYDLLDLYNVRNEGRSLESTSK